MDMAAFDYNLKARKRIPKFYENINVVAVLNGFGGAVGFYDAKQLARYWLSSGSKEFYIKYGFIWEPPEQLQNKVRMHL